MSVHSSKDYFGYTCNDVDQIMDRLRRDLVRICGDENEKDIEWFIEDATDDLKKTVTIPFRDAFDSAIDTLNDEIEYLSNKLENAEREQP